MFMVYMRKSFKDSLKVLEADIQHANTLNKVQISRSVRMPQHRHPLKSLCHVQNTKSKASEFRKDGACLQMRMSYSSAAPLFLFLVQWMDCSLAGSLGLLRILIYKVYIDGTTTMLTHEKKASIKEFYAVIFPSLMQLHMGITDMEDKKQKAICLERYKRRDDVDLMHISEVDAEREEECGICMELNSKIVLPNCNHCMCMKCYRKWHSRSQSCPFCRDSLKGVSCGDLWIFTDSRDIVDMETVYKENLQRLIMYIEKLPVIIPESVFESYDSHVK